jgi:diketogulonate reductase-like aldo/keto reductase
VLGRSSFDATGRFSTAARGRAVMESVTVRGVDVPALGLGTWKLRGNECRETVETALDLGYRHIDTAAYYGNQREIGDAIADSPVDREELFVTTKVRGSNLAAGDVRKSFANSREALGLDIVDLFLIHWPSSSVPITETIGAMNDLQSEGSLQHIGVSNFSVLQLREAIEASKTPILTNQVEYHPFENRSDLLAFCIDHDVMLTAYSPFDQGASRVLDNDSLAEIGATYDKTPAQVALRWLIQQEVVSAIPKATSREHLASNVDIFDFELSDEEMAQVFDLQGGLVGRVRSALGL